MTNVIGLSSISELLDRHATLLADRPWLGPVGFPLTAVTPVAEGSEFALVDEAGDALPINRAGRSGWIAVSVAAGKPVAVNVTTDGRSVRLLSVLDGGRFIDLAGDLEAA